MKTNNNVMPEKVLELQERLKKHVDADKREEFYMEGYEYLTRMTLNKLIRKYGYDVNIRYDEDLRQEIAMQLYNLIINFKPVRQEMPAKKIVKKFNNKTQIFYEEVVDYIEVQMLDFKDFAESLPFLQAVLISRTISRLGKYFHSLNSINSEIAISAIIDVDSWGGDFADNEISILDRIQDKATELEIDAIGLVESIQGTLSKGEYSFLLSWMKEGKKPYNNNLVQRNIAIKLKRQGITDTRAIAEAIRQEIYRLNVKEHKLSEKLYKLAGI